MSKRDNLLLLEDMLEAASKIQLYTKDYTFETFIKDDKTIDAEVRNFSVIGEAANRIDTEYQSQYSEISWSRIRGFRNRVVHEYFGMDNKIIWSSIKSDLPTLSLKIRAIIDRLNSQTPL